MGTGTWVRDSHWDRYLGMTAAMTQIPVPTAAPHGCHYEGGLDIRGQPADTRTPEQKATLRRLLEDLKRKYPKALILGHHDLNPQKACPCIPDVAREYADLQPKTE